jgi:predicted nucleic acid-binding protein
MEFVLDASVTLSWCFEDEATPYGEAVLDRLKNATALVPAIWALEIANVLAEGERRRRLTEAQSRRFVNLLTELPIVVEPLAAERVFDAVLALARARTLSAYDAAYLELAARSGRPLATQDERLSAAARTTGVRILK